MSRDRPTASWKGALPCRCLSAVNLLEGRAESTRERLDMSTTASKVLLPELNLAKVRPNSTGGTARTHAPLKIEWRAGSLFRTRAFALHQLYKRANEDVGLELGSGRGGIISAVVTGGQGQAPASGGAVQVYRGRRFIASQRAEALTLRHYIPPRLHSKVWDSTPPLSASQRFGNNTRECLLCRATATRQSAIPCPDTHPSRLLCGVQCGAACGMVGCRTGPGGACRLPCPTAAMTVGLATALRPSQRCTPRAARRSEPWPEGGRRAPWCRSCRPWVLGKEGC